jgi:HSP20 family protein
VDEKRRIELAAEEIQELFDELWQLPRFARPRQGFRPHVDVVRHEKPPELVVVAELAGVDPASVNVILDDQLLVLAGERKRPHSRGRYEQMEIDYGPFQRHVALSEAVDAERARAEYRRGLLTIVLPIAVKRRRPAKVEIVVSRRA